VALCGHWGGRRTKGGRGDLAGSVSSSAVLSRDITIITIMFAVAVGFGSRYGQGRGVLLSKGSNGGGGSDSSYRGESCGERRRGRDGRRTISRGGWTRIVSVVVVAV